MKGNMKNRFMPIILAIVLVITPVCYANASADEANVSLSSIDAGELYNGRMIRVVGGGERDYFVMNKVKRFIPNYNTRINLFKITGTEVPKAVFDSIPTGEPLSDGAMLIRPEGLPWVFLLTNGKRHFVVNSATFDYCSFKWDKVKDFPSIVVYSIPEGDEIRV